MNTRYDYRDKFDIQPVSDSVMIYHVYRLRWEQFIYLDLGTTFISY